VKSVAKKVLNANVKIDILKKDIEAVVRGKQLYRTVFGKHENHK